MSKDLEIFLHRLSNDLNSLFLSYYDFSQEKDQRSFSQFYNIKTNILAINSSNLIIQSFLNDIKSHVSDYEQKEDLSSKKINNYLTIFRRLIIELKKKDFYKEQNYKDLLIDLLIKKSYIKNGNFYHIEVDDSSLFNYLSSTGLFIMEKMNNILKISYI